ncbi:MAG: hypothetical protein D6B27_12195 [Gammaproteobacteria bacterium]|mgnify:CR=1 FL=1|nr:MAG: hypothetical protein D6B27_12195 [Gammaproteobacteria bacterium]
MAIIKKVIIFLIIAAVAYKVAPFILDKAKQAIDESNQALETRKKENMKEQKNKGKSTRESMDVENLLEKSHRERYEKKF